MEGILWEIYSDATAIFHFSCSGFDHKVLLEVEALSLYFFGGV